MGGAGFLFDPAKLQAAVGHANVVCEQYGVQIISINVISAFPVDGKLMNALAAGAVAAAEAEQAEMCAKGRSKAMMIDAKAEAEAQRVRAQVSGGWNWIQMFGYLLLVFSSAKVFFSSTCRQILQCPPYFKNVFRLRAKTGFRTAGIPRNRLQFRGFIGVRTAKSLSVP